VGTAGSSAVLFDGTINGNTGTTYFPINYPLATETTVYGPDLTESSNIRLVGTYKANGTAPVVVNGFVFQGTTAGGLAVGNYTSEDEEGHLEPGRAFIYDIANDEFLPDVVFPGSQQTSAYGIWWNGGTKYTIAGGYSDGLEEFVDGQPLGTCYMVDFNSATGKFSH
jgi:trimeric autotransporter adhesin